MTREGRQKELVPEIAMYPPRSAPTPFVWMKIGGAFRMPTNRNPTPRNLKCKTFFLVFFVCQLTQNSLRAT